jgi:beta-galactosidase
MAIPAALPPDLPTLETRVARVESLRPAGPVPLEAGGAFHIWREITDGASEVAERTADGEPALRRAGNLRYLCGWPDRTAMRRLLGAAAREAGLATLDLPDGLRRVETAGEVFWFNYAASPAALAEVAGDPDLPASLAPADLHRRVKG